VHWASFLADVLVVIHWGVVAFVVGGQLLFIAGAIDWRLVGTDERAPGLRGLIVRATRNPWIRIGHLVTMAWIVVNTWLGKLCFLTVWEYALRDLAGEARGEASFIERWLADALYVEAPWWVFVAVYTGFFALVIATLMVAPPRWRRGSG
jgi:hypothetical protein